MSHFPVRAIQLHYTDHDLGGEIEGDWPEHIVVTRAVLQQVKDGVIRFDPVEQRIMFKLANGEATYQLIHQDEACLECTLINGEVR